MPNFSVLRRFSRVRLFVTPWTIACQVPLAGKNTGVGHHFLLQQNFSNQNQIIFVYFIQINKICILLNKLLDVGRTRCLHFTFNTVSVQFSSVAQSCLTLCNPMNCSMPSLPVHPKKWETIVFVHRSPHTAE